MTKTLKINSNSIIFILVLSIIILILLLFKGCDKIGSLQNSLTQVTESANDTITRIKNKLGQEEAKTLVIQGTIEDLKLIHASDSSELGRLKNIVNKHTVSATTATTNTNNSISSATQIVYLHDTLEFPCDTIFPEYITKYENKWEKFDVKAGKDSIKIDYTVFNEFSVVQEFEKKGNVFNRKYIPVLMITNNNPHTTTLNAKSFMLQPIKDKRWRYFAIGSFVGFLGTSIIVFYTR